MTVKELERLLDAAERHTNGVTVTFFAIVYPESLVTKMRGYVTFGFHERMKAFATEDELRRLLKALGGN